MARPPDGLLLAEFNCLVDRLQRGVLYPDEERERALRRNEFERVRAAKNLDFARSKLQRLEHDALAIKAISRRQDAQVHLNAQREILDDVAERLRDIAEIHDSDDDASDSPEEDWLAEILGTTSTGEASTATPTKSNGRAAEATAPAASPPAAPTLSVPAQTAAIKPATRAAPETTAAPTGGPGSATESPATTALHGGPGPTAPPTTATVQTLRSRAVGPGQPQPTAAAAASGADARAALFGGVDKLALSRQQAPSTSGSTVAVTEAILDRQRAEREALERGLLDMAASLKQSSLEFGATLEQDKDVLGAAGTGLDKTGRGMDAATRRMGTVRRMAEGEGWWGRMLLYAWIYGLMLLCLLIVAVGPKLRFR